MASSSSRSCSWTKEENKRFEVALALYGEETPDRWHNVAAAVGSGKSVDQVKRHYEQLLTDIRLIDSAQEPFFHYSNHNARRRSASASTGAQEQRLRFLKLH